MQITWVDLIGPAVVLVFSLLFFFFSLKFGYIFKTVLIYFLQSGCCLWILELAWILLASRCGTVGLALCASAGLAQVRPWVPSQSCKDTQNTPSPTSLMSESGHK
jgi:hypothetical protein